MGMQSKMKLLSLIALSHIPSTSALWWDLIFALFRRPGLGPGPRTNANISSAPSPVIAFVLPCNGDHYKTKTWDELVSMGLGVALNTLGHDETSWEQQGGDVATTGKLWDELSKGEKVAAAVFCYDQYLWNGCSPTDERTCKDTGLYDEDKWNDIPLSVQINLILLGWTEEIWDKGNENNYPVSESTPWDQLTAMEQIAAINICHDRNTWNGCSIPSAFPSEAPSISVSPSVSASPSSPPSASPSSLNCNGNHYEDISWEDLVTMGLQDALNTLGYDEISWDNSEDIDIVGKDWEKLKKDEMVAAGELCYDQLSWDGCNGVENRICFETDLYDDDDWKDIPEDSRIHYETLGWTEEVWDNERESDFPASESADWDDLTEEEKSAASALCHDRNSWNGCDPGTFVPTLSPTFSTAPSRSPSVSPSSLNCNGNHYEEMTWVELVYMGLGGALITLGYNEVSWNNDEIVATSDTYWEKLKKEEQEAAEELCYDEMSWDECNGEDNRICFDNRLYDDEYWNDVPPEFQAHFEVLGWTEQSWNSGNSGEYPASQSTTWEDLSVAEKEAAIALCFDQNTWNGCDAGTFYPTVTPTASNAPSDSPSVSPSSLNCNGNHYEEMAWDELVAMDLEDALITLGYDEMSWNKNNDVSSVNEKKWDDLTKDQAEAAQEFCYNQMSWDGCSELDNRVCFETGTYDDDDWVDLPWEIRMYYGVLGWNQENWDGDESGYPASDSKTWEELSTEEIFAATMLCHDQNTWNGCAIPQN